MSDKFETQIDRIVINTQQKLLNVMRESIKNTVNEAQVPTAKGGKMRVKTGFLRSSGVANLNGMPAGLGQGDKTKTYVWDGEALTTILTRMKFGDVFYWGWTANYAKYREAFDAFLESALMNWQSHVDKEVAYYRNKDAK